MQPGLPGAVVGTEALDNKHRGLRHDLDVGHDDDDGKHDQHAERDQAAGIDGQK